MKILRSCEELARHGVGKNGDYLVDPDGELLSQDPIMVHCIFDEGPAITEISHYQEKPIIVDHCDSKECYEQSIEYNVPLAQIEALISDIRQSIDRNDCGKNPSFWKLEILVYFLV